MLSIKEVARLTGLSTATVSRALDPRWSSRVRPETREKILAVCDSADFRPRMAGRSFVTGKSFKVGFISGDPAGDFGNPLFGRFLQGASFRLQASGYSLLLLSAPHTPEQDTKVVDFLRSGVADAYILGSALVKGRAADAVRKCRAPVLMLERQQEFPDALIIRRDPRPAFRQIWENVPARWNGKVAFCAMDSALYRYTAVRECAPEGFSLPLVKLGAGKNFMEIRNNARDAAAKIATRLGKYKLLWCSSDLAALGVKDALEQKGLRAGRDFFLVGFDNMEETTGFEAPPFLSTVDSCWEGLGNRAAAMILDSLEGRTPPSPAEFPLRYIPRASFPGDPLSEARAKAENGRRYEKLTPQHERITE